MNTERRMNGPEFTRYQRLTDILYAGTMFLGLIGTITFAALWAVIAD